MNGLKAPGWLRAADILLGLIAIILSIVVLAYPDLAILTLILILSASLLIIGIARTAIGIFANYLSSRLRAVNLVVGVTSLALAGLSILYPQFATQMLLYLLSFALMLNGIARIIVGGLADILPGWLRGLLLLIGVLTIGFSLAVVLFPAWGYLTLILILAVTFLLNGIARIVSGITGIRD